ncbi:cell division protein ZapA [Desulfurobacterium pacificum]|uniref:Cell division protein ZapA n=1 Tax=Desulfurobacterium pacificum TaxID=240166 RepID=A0ABY1NNZ8_9BACT|nr:cell division protein ZapA [Desulfurobacterium pacificum]SMP14327.1 cell division protein ZapA [Desulfurobacterium pacificum]
MSLPETVEVTIAGRKFNIKTDKDPQYVKELALRLENMISRIKSGNSRVTLDKALIIACFYLLDENESLKSQIKELGEEIKRLEEGAKLLITSKKIAP